MSRYLCPTCKGEYHDPQPDGRAYNHTCPPIVDPKTLDATPREGHRDENRLRGKDGVVPGRAKVRE